MSLNIVWWNAYNFFHFDSAFKNTDRWPKTSYEYGIKCDLVDAALSELQSIVGDIDILCLCEISKISAEQLRDRLFPGFRVISLDVAVDKPTLQVAIIHRESSNLVELLERPFIRAQRAPKTTRPMAVLEIRVGAKRIQIICCHWTARIKEEDSEDVRYECAHTLGSYCYDFVKDSANNNVVIIGDLNEEPFERSLRALHAHRYRSRSLSKSHHTDEPVKRLHLYNLSWRHLGEQHPHKHSIKSSKILGCAGTYYRSERREWHSFDQVIVSGGLLSNSKPFLDESDVLVVSSGKFLKNGFPEKFSVNDSNVGLGLSDHLPLYVKVNI
jgi:endonuclease/exonuclease/phosphatase family metal-dependent hydrolase